MVDESSQTHFDGLEVVVVALSVCYSKIAGNYSVIKRKQNRLPIGSDVGQYEIYVKKPREAGQDI